MAEFLVKAIDAVHPDPDKDAEACYKKGDIVSIFEDGGIGGSGMGPPAFVVVKVPGLSLQTVQDRREDWRQEIGYEVVAQNASVDGVRVRIYTETPGAANEYGLTREKVENWLNNWGASVVSVAQNEVRFDITVAAAYQSAGFWGADPAAYGVALNELSYDQATGVHVVAVVASDEQKFKMAKAQVQRSGATITNEVPATFTLTAEFTRTQVRQHFIDALKEAMLKTVRRRRYCFDPADVDTALAAGGVVTLTPAQLAAKVRDKAV